MPSTVLNRRRNLRLNVPRILITLGLRGKNAENLTRVQDCVSGISRAQSAEFYNHGFPSSNASKQYRRISPGITDLEVVVVGDVSQKCVRRFVRLLDINQIHAPM